MADHQKKLDIRETKQLSSYRPSFRRILAIGLAAIGVVIFTLIYLPTSRSLNELLRYADKRLEGHPKLEFLATPAIAAVRTNIERPVEGELPSLGKGQLKRSLVLQIYEKDGAPKDSVANNKTQLHSGNIILVINENDLNRALKDVKPGQIIEFPPGIYAMKGNFHTTTRGTAQQPITIRAQIPGSVTLELNSTEGFNISEPYWIIENLNIKGICKADSSCEHAIHIVGKARSTVIRNNWIEDFNAHIKVNGLQNDWPDYGLIQHNTLTNSRPRNTNTPVTPIDIVGVSGWHITDNVIKNFAKSGGNQISFGAFIKGAGKQGRFERNLVICTDKDVSQAGARVGLSLGGGGTTPSVCRDQRCITEHSEGAIINNIIAHCNDVAIYLNKSNQSIIAHNTLINTSGIDVRFGVSSAEVYGNLLEGSARTRDGALIESRHNLTTQLSTLFEKPDQLNLEWRKSPDLIPTHTAVSNDFCRRARPVHSLPGALGISSTCPTAP